MRYFGEPGDAPVYENVERAATPTGQLCSGCFQVIEGGDQGFLIPYLGVTDPDLWEAPWHKSCWLLHILGPIAEQID